MTRQQVDPAAAEEFLGLYHAECPDARPARLRVEEVRSEIDPYGTYTHTAAEQVAAESFAHLREATNGGGCDRRSPSSLPTRPTAPARGSGTSS